MRLRILFGTLLLIVWLSLYALLVMAMATRLLPDHWAVQMAFYAVAGIAWMFPAARLTGWMQRAGPFRPPEIG